MRSLVDADPPFERISRKPLSRSQERIVPDPKLTTRETAIRFTSSFHPESSFGKHRRRKSRAKFMTLHCRLMLHNHAVCTDNVRVRRRRRRRRFSTKPACGTQTHNQSGSIVPPLLLPTDYGSLVFLQKRNWSPIDQEV